MKSIHPPLLLLAAFALIANVTGHAATPSAAATKPDADQILRQMSAKLGAAREFSFKAHRHTHGAVLPGHEVPVNAQIAVTVKRPNRIVAKSVSRGDARDFYFDGRNLTMFDATKNFYATAPMRTSIDGLLPQVETKYGFTPPLGELAVSDVYADIRHKAQSVSYLGRSRVAGGFLGLGGVECERVHLLGKGVDAELWIAVADQLPRKLVVIFKNHPGQPKLTAEFSDWNLAAKVSDQAFVFQAPKGALKIPMLSTADLKAAPSKPAKKKQ